MSLSQCACFSQMQNMLSRSALLVLTLGRSGQNERHTAVRQYATSITNAHTCTRFDATNERMRNIGREGEMGAAAT